MQAVDANTNYSQTAHPAGHQMQLLKGPTLFKLYFNVMQWFPNLTAVKPTSETLSQRELPTPGTIG